MTYFEVLNCRTTKTKYNVILNTTPQPKNEISRAKHRRSEQVGFDPAFMHSRFERCNVEPNIQRGLLAKAGTATFGALYSPRWAPALVLSTG